MPSDRERWTGCFTNKRPDAGEISLVAPLKPSTQGGSGSFLGLASDGQRYWIKTTNNFQHPQVPVSEQIVGRVGTLLGVAVCPVKSVEITDDVAKARWEIRPGAGRFLEKGTAHASLEVVDCYETRQFEKRDQDNNASRHVGLLALYDLCWGSDVQWLVASTQEYAYHGHDHGHFMSGPGWTVAGLLDALDKPHEQGDNGANLNKDAITTIANKLDGLTQDLLVESLSKIPSTLPVSDAELETAGHFVLHRASTVASRIRARWLGG